MHERLELAKQDKRKAVELAQIEVASELQKAATAKDAEIHGLKAKLDTIEDAQKLTITEEVSAIEKEQDELKGGLEREELERQLAQKSLKATHARPMRRRIGTCDSLGAFCLLR